MPGLSRQILEPGIGLQSKHGFGRISCGNTEPHRLREVPDELSSKKIMPWRQVAKQESRSVLGQEPTSLFHAVILNEDVTVRADDPHKGVVEGPSRGVIQDVT
jgi:hypothetical protein